MPDAVQFTLADGTVVLVAPPARAGTGAVGLGTRLESAARTLQEALAPITTAASEVIGQFRNVAQRPDEVQVTFGVVLDGKLGAVLASANASAHLDVTLRWSTTDTAGTAGTADPTGPAPDAGSPTPS